jgi:hypothetical protein
MHEHRPMFVHIGGGWGPMQHCGISPQEKFVVEISPREKCSVLGFPARRNLVVGISPNNGKSNHAGGDWRGPRLGTKLGGFTPSFIELNCRFFSPRESEADVNIPF